MRLALLPLLAALAPACGPGLDEGLPELGPDLAHDASLSDVRDQGYSCREYHDTTYQHVVEQRAYVCGGYACARGSSDNLGLYNTFITVYLREVRPNHYELGRCMAK